MESRSLSSLLPQQPPKPYSAHELLLDPGLGDEHHHDHTKQSSNTEPPQHEHQSWSGQHSRTKSDRNQQLRDHYPAVYPRLGAQSFTSVIRHIHVILPHCRSPHKHEQHEASQVEVVVGGDAEDVLQ